MSETKTISASEVIRSISAELNAARGLEALGLFIHPEARDALISAGLIDGGEAFMGVLLLPRSDIKPLEPEAVDKWRMAKHLVNKWISLDCPESLIESE